MQMQMGDSDIFYFVQQTLYGENSKHSAARILLISCSLTAVVLHTKGKIHYHLKNFLLCLKT